MASTKKSKPRRIVPSCNLVLISLRTRPRLCFLAIVTALGLIILFRRDGLVGVMSEDRVRTSTRQLTYDRERERDGKVWFPALDELVDRDRLWPPDLSESPFRIVVDSLVATVGGVACGRASSWWVRESWKLVRAWSARNRVFVEADRLFPLQRNQSACPRSTCVSSPRPS
jgi:hypothetical protein